jgi:hypothetical protein
MFDIAPDPRDVEDGWSDARQYLYSLVWSSFLDLDRYTASRAFRRFLPYSSVWVAYELLHERRKVANLRFGDRRQGSELDKLRLCPLATDLALWTVAPGLFSPMKGADALGGQGATGDDEEFVAKLRDLFREDHLERFGVDLAAASLDPEFRPILPPRPELGIEAPITSVRAGRRFATVRIEANVQRPFFAMRDVVDPSTWSRTGHWRLSGKVDQVRGTRWAEMHLRLPGGRFALSQAKNRKLRMKFEIARGPFARRVDYAAFETGAPTQPSIEPYEDAPQQVEEQDVFQSPYDPRAVHIRGMRGFLGVEKLAGRPRWSRLIAERTVAFESPNHDRFRVETLLFWLSSELLAFVANRECS